MLGKDVYDADDADVGVDREVAGDEADEAPEPVMPAPPFPEFSSRPSLPHQSPGGGFESGRDSRAR